MLGRTIGRVKAIARRLKRRAVQIAAIGCIAGGAIFGPHDGAAAEKLRVGINLTTIETLPIYRAADGRDAIEPSGAPSRL